MRRILFCWEMGEDYGHISKIQALTQSFNQEHDQIYIAAKDLSIGSELHWSDNVNFIQAPLWPKSSPLALRAESFAEILLYRGYDKFLHLNSLVGAWETLFKLISPDLILFDHAPTAMLASSNLKLPKVIASNPFITPSPGSESVNLTPGRTINMDKAKQIHEHIVKQANKVREQFKLHPIETIGDIFIADATFLSGYPELDFYPQRSNVIYCGPALSTSIGHQKPQWKPGFSKKILAYLKYQDERSRHILDALKMMQARALCFYSNCKPDDLHQYDDTSMVVSNIPFAFSDAYREASAVICHGGQGVVNEAISHGIPLIVVPTQAEQYYTAIKIKELGLGIIIEKSDVPASIEQKLSEFFSNPAYAENAKRQAESKFRISPSEAIEKIINSCYTLIDARKAIA